MFGPHHAFALPDGFSYLTAPALVRVLPSPARAFPMRPCSSVIPQYRNINLLSIGYAFRPRLRSRLTQGGRTCPWKPWSYGVLDSHQHLATYTGILTSVRSTTPYGIASTLYTTLPYHSYCYESAVSVLCLAPVNFRRKATRLVSCYALFEGWLLLSQPPSCLRDPTSFPTRPGFRGLIRRSGLFPS